MQISDEGKIGIALALLGLGGGGALFVLPHPYADYVGWSQISISVVGLALLGLHHFRRKAGGSVGMTLAVLGTALILIGGLVGLIGAFKIDAAKMNGNRAPEGLLYFDADLRGKTTADSIPLQLHNTSDEPFLNVRAWFSPASAKGNPDPPGGPYWTLAHLKYVNSVQQAGVFWSGQQIPLGYYRIEMIANKDKSVGFNELLELREFEGKIIQLVDVWAGGQQGGGKLYTSPRPDELRDSRTLEEP
jgi:hypothetical protein